MPNLPLPEADPATSATIKDWLARFAGRVREVDYGGAIPFWHDDIVIFGTYRELLRSRQAWTENQWDNVWPRTADFAFDLANTLVLASPDGAMAVAVAPWTSTGSTRTARPSRGRAGRRSCWRGSRTGAGSACTAICRWARACRRTAMASGR